VKFLHCFVTNTFR